MKKLYVTCTYCAWPECNQMNGGRGGVSWRHLLWRQHRLTSCVILQSLTGLSLTDSVWSSRRGGARKATVQTERRITLNSSNPFHFFFLWLQGRSSNYPITGWIREPCLFSHWTKQPSQAVSPCGVARQNVRHLNSSERRDSKKQWG